MDMLGITDAHQIGFVVGWLLAWVIAPFVLRRC